MFQKETEGVIVVCIALHCTASKLVGKPPQGIVVVSIALRCTASKPKLVRTLNVGDDGGQDCD